MATIKQLADRKAKLLADLAKVNEEITHRAGEIDKPDAPAKKTAEKTE